MGTAESERLRPHGLIESLSISYFKPYANWALPGAACPYAIEADGRSSIDNTVLEAVGMQLVGTLDWLFPGQKISDERVPSGDDSESSDDEQKMSGWCLKVAAAAGL
jgi:hypothetical protein